MSFSEFTTLDNRWGVEGDDESDFGEFSSASPKSEGTATENNLTITANLSTSSASNRCGQPTHFGRSFGAKLCNEVRQREPNGYIVSQKILPHEDCKSMEAAEVVLANFQLKMSNICTGDVHQNVSNACRCKSSLGDAKLCVMRPESEVSDSILTSCTDPHSSIALRNCHSWSPGDDKITSACPGAEKSSKCVDRHSVLSGPEVIGSVQSDLGQVKPVCNLTGSVGWQDSSVSSEQISNANSSSSVNAQIKSDNSCTHAGNICETCEFDDFQSVLHADDFQHKKTKPAGNQNHSWASFGDIIVSADSDESWLAFQDIDVKTGTPDDPDASQTVDSHLVVIPPYCAVSGGAADDNFSQLEVDKKKDVIEFLQLAFPSSASSSSCGKEQSSIRETNLLDLIGEHSKESLLAVDPKCSSVTNRHSLSSAAVWNSLKVMEDTAALKFHWNGSRSNRLLLKSVAMESPTRLNTRRIQKLPTARTVQEIQDFRGSGAARVSCRQPYESSFSQTVLSVTHLRM